MKLNFLLQLSFLAGGIPTFANAQEGNEKVECLLAQRHPLMLDGSGGDDHFNNNGYLCFGENGVSWDVEGLPDDFFNSEELVSGETVLSISSAAKIKANENGPDKLKVNSGAAISLSKSQGRQPGRMLRQRKTRELAQKVGQSTVLVVRVTDMNGLAPALSAADLHQHFFADAVNLASQYAACSNNQLTFVPATGYSQINNGVIDVTVNYDVSGKNSETVESYAIAAVQAIVTDESQWDHVMYVLPNEVNFNGVSAYAYLNLYRSVYWDTYSSKLLVLMHEIGHNLGLEHSGKGAQELGDFTGFMGNSYYADDGPVNCFNGPKSWQLGWYQSGHTTVTPGNWDGLLVGVDDYNKGNFDSSIHSSIVKVDNPSSPIDLYVMYNRKKGVNAGVPGYGDYVTVISQQEGSYKSLLVAGLTESTASYRDTSWPGAPLVIEVCSRSSDGATDEARVLVYLDDGVNNLYCGGSQPPTTAGPTTLEPTCPLAKVDESCKVNEDCCSGSCSGGNVASRVCLEGGGGDGPSICLAPGSKCNLGTCCSGQCSKGKCL